MVRVARPTSSGWPVPLSTIGTTAASQHSIRSDSGATGPPKSRHPARARFSQIVEPDQHVEVWAVPTALREHRRGRVVEHIPAHVGQRLGLPLPGAAVVVAR